jgi:alkaline phosphatase
MLLGTGLAMSPANALQAADSQRRLRIGMLSDLHYADKPPAGSRHYRETLTKIAEAGAQFAQDKPDIVV